MILLSLLEGRTTQELNSIRDCIGNGATLAQFTDTLVPFYEDITLTVEQKKARLANVFRTIDTNEDATVSWDEFSAYAIDDALRLTAPMPHEEVKSYTCTKVVSTPDAVLSMKHIPEWDTLAVFTKQLPIMLYEASTFERRATQVDISDLKGTVLSCEYIPQQAYFVISGADQRLRFYDVSNNDIVLKRKIPTDCSQLVLVDHKASCNLLCGGRDGKLSAWSVGRTQHSIHRRNCFQLHSEAICELLLSPHYSHIAWTCSLDGSILQVDLDKSTHTLYGKNSTGVTRIAYTHQYQFLLSAGFEPYALAWISNAPKCQPHVLNDLCNPHKGQLVGLHASDTTPQVVTVDECGMIKVWDIRMFKCVHTLAIGTTEDERMAREKRTQKVNHSVFIQDRLQVVCSSWRQVFVHGYNQGSDPNFADELAVRIVKYSSVVNAIVTVSGCDVKIWDSNIGCLAIQYKDIVGPYQEITALTIDQFGRFFYVGSHSGKVCCFHFRSGQLINEFPAHQSEVTSIQNWSARRMVLTTGLDGYIHIVDERDENTNFTKVQVGMEILCSSSARNLSMFMIGTVSQLLQFDVFNPRRPISECQTNDGQVSAVHVLGHLPAVTVAYGNGRLRIFNSRPYRVSTADVEIQDTSENSFASFCLAVWKNDPERQRRRNRLYRRSERPKTTFGQAIQFLNGERQSNHWDFMTALTASPLDKADKNSHGQYVAVVMSMAYNSASHVLYTGDDRGIITAWTLCAVLKTCSLMPTSYPVKNDIAQAASSIHHKRFNPKHVSRQIRVSKLWKAHQDEILSMEFVQSSEILITSSEDRRVLLWNANGTPLAELSQGRTYENGYGINPVYNAETNSDEDTPTTSKDDMSLQGESFNVYHPALQTPLYKKNHWSWSNQASAKTFDRDSIGSMSPASVELRSAEVSHDRTSVAEPEVTFVLPEHSAVTPRSQRRSSKFIRTERRHSFNALMKPSPDTIKSLNVSFGAAGKFQESSENARYYVERLKSSVFTKIKRACTHVSPPLSPDNSEPGSQYESSDEDISSPTTAPPSPRTAKIRKSIVKNLSPQYHEQDNELQWNFKFGSNQTGEANEHGETAGSVISKEKVDNLDRLRSHRKTKSSMAATHKEGPVGNLVGSPSAPPPTTAPKTEKELNAWSRNEFVKISRAFETLADSTERACEGDAAEGSGLSKSSRISQRPPKPKPIRLPDSKKLVMMPLPHTAREHSRDRRSEGIMPSSARDFRKEDSLPAVALQKGVLNAANYGRRHTGNYATSAAIANLNCEDEKLRKKLNFSWSEGSALGLDSHRMPRTGDHLPTTPPKTFVDFQRGFHI